MVRSVEQTTFATPSALHVLMLMSGGVHTCSSRLCVSCFLGFETSIYNQPVAQELAAIVLTNGPPKLGLRCLLRCAEIVRRNPQICNATSDCRFQCTI